MNKWAELLKGIVELEDGCKHAIYNINMKLICHHPAELAGVLCNTSSKCYKVQSSEQTAIKEEND